MPSVRGEITRTLLRLSRRLQSRPGLREVPPLSPLRRKVPAFREGTEFGNYKILNPLGAGGMGHVYLATQSPLGRKVALKFLSPELVAEPEMLRRLLEEAKMVATLNHANILTIYEVGERNGAHFIASEYVEGQTLRSALNKREVDTQGAVDIGCQILAALDRAHAAGIIHRDLKPGNIMIRSDGYVKVIDFGLAKRTRSGSLDDAEDERSLTRPGAVVGTVFYMSPEQACGDKVDHRTDIWSLGIILFEIITRRRPFEGDSDNRVIVNICSKPLPPIPNATELPSGLLEVIERALQKDPDDRYGSAREMLNALSTVGLGAESRSITRPAVLRPYRRRRFLLPVAGVLTLLVGIAVWLAYRSFHQTPDWFQIDKVRQLTFNGRVLSAAISPDGKYLAYVSGDPEGFQAVSLMQVNGASEVVKIPARNTKYLGLTFAPDDQLFVVAKNRDDLVGRLYEVPVVGDAPPKPIITDIDGPVAFSPAGDRIAFVRNAPAIGPTHTQTRGSIFLADRANPAASKPIYSTLDFALSRYLAWSPASDRVAAILFSFSQERSGKTALAQIWPDGKSKLLALPTWQIVGNLAWDPNGKSLFTTSADTRETAVQSQLRQIELQGGELRDLTRDLAGYQSASLPAQGNHLAVIKTESKASIWISEKGDFAHGASSWAELERRPNLAWFSAEQLVVGSLRGGFPNLWLFSSNDQSRTPLTREDFAEEEAVSIPGGHAVIFTSRRTGQAKLWLYDTDENQFRQLTFGPNADHSPTVSPDGKWVIYSSASSTTPHLLRLLLSGGAPEQIASFAAQSPSISPNGKKVLCWMQDAGLKTWGLAVAPLDHPNAVQKVGGVGLPAIWSPTANEISAVLTDIHGTSNIWNIALNSGKRRKVTAFNDQTIVKLAWSRDGSRLACLRSSSTSDVVLYSRKNR